MKHMHKLIPLLFLIPLISGCNNAPIKYIGIVSAMDNEIALLLEQGKLEKKGSDGEVDYYVGKLRDKDVVITKSGIGKVRATLGVTKMLNEYNIKEVYFTGIAGGLLDEEKVLDVVIADKLVEHDYGRLTNEGFIWTGGDPGKGTDKGEYYYCDPELVKLAFDSAIAVMGEEHVFKGAIATGDQFIENESYCAQLVKQFDAYACEMEGASVTFACSIHNIPVVVIRSLSDKADGHAHDSYADFGDIAARNSSQIILKMLESR